MTGQDSPGAPESAARLPLILGGAAVAMVMTCCLGLVMVVGGAVGGAVGARQGTQGSRLRPDAPIAPQYLEFVLQAGSLCPELGPAEIAAQIDLESSWNPNAVAHNPPERGGDAMGIAQFQAGTWATWGHDYDNNGSNSPYDPGDAIVAMGHLMCDNVAWAKQMLAAKPPRLHGDVLDLAWAAYFDGRGGILAAGGVPAAGLAHDYPQQVRSRLPTYAAVDSGGAPVGPGGWSLPLPKGSYSLSSPFGPRWGSFHYGQDFAAATGTPIYAAAAGTVIEADCTSPTCAVPGSLDMPGGGWTVVISHGGICTRYHHAVRLGVAAGQQVQAGQVIAWVGSTGHSTGPHLHFEVHRGAPPVNNANAIDPMPFLRSVGLNP